MLLYFVFIFGKIKWLLLLLVVVVQPTNHLQDTKRDIQLKSGEMLIVSPSKLDDQSKNNFRQ